MQRIDSGHARPTPDDAHDEPIVKLTGGGPGGKYTWRRVCPDPATPGHFMDVPEGVTDAPLAGEAIEVNFNESLPTDGTLRVALVREPVSGLWTFQLD